MKRTPNRGLWVAPEPLPFSEPLLCGSGYWGNVWRFKTMTIMEKIWVAYKDYAAARETLGRLVRRLGDTWAERRKSLASLAKSKGLGREAARLFVFRCLEAAGYEPLKGRAGKNARRPAFTEAFEKLARRYGMAPRQAARKLARHYKLI